MPEEKDDGQKPLETTPQEGAESDKPIEGEEGEKPEEEEKQVNIQPQKRFPEKDQSAAEKRAAYWERKAKALEKSQVDRIFNEDEEEEEKPLTRREFEEVIAQQERKSSTERMLSQFLEEKPDYKKYEKAIRAHLDDPDYANIPIGFIADGIVGRNIDIEANERADIKLKANEAAAKTKTGGSTKRGIPAKKAIWDMSKEEFEEYSVQALKAARERE